MKIKTWIWVLALVVVLGGSLFLYNLLGDRMNTGFTEENETSALAESSGAGEAAEAAEEAAEEAEEAEEAVEERTKAPDFTVIDGEGNAVTLSQMLGKPVVLNFWASWCPPCKAEMPEFDLVYEELGSEVHFMMIDAVDGSRETQETGAAYVAEQGFHFPVYFDIGQEAIMQYGIRAFPTTIFIDRDGYIVAGAQGQIDEDTLRKGIDMILNEE